MTQGILHYPLITTQKFISFYQHETVNLSKTGNQPINEEQ